LTGIVAALTTKYTIIPITIGEPKPGAPIEKYEERNGEWGQKYRQKIYEINLKIPFTGNAKLFDCSPSSTTTVIWVEQKFLINIDNIDLRIVMDKLDAGQYQSAVEKFISQISANLPRIESEVNVFNQTLENHIKALLQKRGALVAEKFDFMQKIGLQINPKSDDFMIPSPIKTREIPTPIAETATGVKREFIPVLQEDVYIDIKAVIYNVGKAIERKPSLYIGKHEEDLRDIFLLFLETRYDSTTGVGEAFNKKGSTDILLKYAKDGTNLFVAECKIWKGQKELHKGVDQLFGYLTLRDSKAALIIFVDQKEFTSVTSTVREEIKNHSQFKNHITDTYDTSFAYEFTFPGDALKIIQVEVILFHFPKKTN